MNAKYSKRILIKDKASIGFNPIAHYDVNIYLNEMVLKANQIDKQFQNDMESIINCINENEEMIKFGMLGYRSGPVKQQQRAKTKVEVDYAKEAYPTASMLLDLNRCTINCKSIESMLCGLELFVTMINLKKTSIIGVTRCKNGWSEFDFNIPGYTDIKLNVIITSKRHGALIGEVQFLLDLMADYKLKAHSLYSVERHKEFVENMKSIMPLSLNLEQQLFTLANYGDYKGLLHYVITNDLMNGTNNLLKANFKNQSILTSMCRFDCVKAFTTIKKLCDKKEFDDMLHLCDDVGHAPIGYAIEANSTQILEILMKLYPKSVTNYFKEDLQNTDGYDDPGDQGVLYYSCRNNNVKLTKWVLKNTVFKDKNFSCLMEYCKYRHFHVVKSLLSKEIVGDDGRYHENVCAALDKKDSNGWSALHYAANKGWDILEFIFDLIANTELKFKYLNQKNNAADTVFKLICTAYQLKSELLAHITNGLNSSQMNALMKPCIDCIDSIRDIPVFAFLCDAIHDKNELIKIVNKRFMSVCAAYTSYAKAQCVISIYKKNNIDVSHIILNERDIENKTILMCACHRSGAKQTDTLNLLFDNINTDKIALLKYINVKDKNGMNALHYSFKTSVVPIGKLILSKIKELNDSHSKDVEGELIRNIVFDADNNGWNLFHFACWNNVKHMEFICQELNMENEEKIQSIITTFNKPNNMTPLMVCCQRGKIANVEYLLDAFGDNFKSKLLYIDVKNANGQSAIDIVNEKKNKKLVKILQDARQQCLSRTNK